MLESCSIGPPISTTPGIVQWHDATLSSLPLSLSVCFGII